MEKDINGNLIFPKIGASANNVEQDIIETTNLATNQLPVDKPMPIPEQIVEVSGFDSVLSYLGTIPSDTWLIILFVLLVIINIFVRKNKDKKIIKDMEKLNKLTNEAVQKRDEKVKELEIIKSFLDVKNVTSDYELIIKDVTNIHSKHKLSKDKLQDLMKALNDMYKEENIELEAFLKILKETYKIDVLVVNDIMQIYLDKAKTKEDEKIKED